MPWKARNPVDLRMEMMVRLGQGEQLTDLCREYGISRKTGEKYKKRFRELGPVGLTDPSRAPKLIPHKTPPELVEVLLAERRLHPTWGPRKLKDVLERRLGHAFPAPSTIGDVLAEHGLIVPRRKRRRHIPRPTGHREVTAPNEVWCIDYKGQFRLVQRFARTWPRGPELPARVGSVFPLEVEVGRRRLSATRRGS